VKCLHEQDVIKNYRKSLKMAAFRCTASLHRFYSYDYIVVLLCPADDVYAGRRQVDTVAGR